MHTSINHGKVRVALAVTVLLGLISATTAVAGKRPVRVNLGTVAPRGSSYHRALQTMAERWRDASDGSVRLVIYPDGTMGGESDMVRLMRVGTLHAALLTAHGLSDIERTVTGLQSMPLRFRDLDEFDYVNEQLRPIIEPRFQRKEFEVLCWIDAGWVRIFSKKPVTHPDDLKSRKIFAWEGDTDQIRIMHDLGLNPVPLDTGDIPTGLRTGLIDVVVVPPVFALAGRIDQQAPYMLDLNWAPLVAAAVIHRKTWMQIPEETRNALQEEAEAAGAQIRSTSRQESHDSVVAMEKRGLTVQTLTPSLREAWQAMAEDDLLPRIRGTVVPEETFDEVQRIIRRNRTQGVKVVE